MKNYDKDGFYVLHPINSQERDIGSSKLIEMEANKINESNGKNVAQDRFLVCAQYDVPYAPKTWQRKVWDCIGRSINWNEKTPFRKFKRVPKKVRHIKKFAITVKVRMFGWAHGGAKPVLERLTPENKRCGTYLVADTPQEFQRILDRIYTMMHDNLDGYLNYAKKNDYGGVDYTCKCLIVYDDKTFDSVTGGVRNMYNLLGLDWNSKKGLEIDEG